MAQKTLEAAAVTPSSRVLELGADLHEVTHALLDYGLSGDRVWALEHNPRRAAQWRKSFPTTHVLRADIRDTEHLHRMGLPAVRVIVSSLAWPRSSESAIAQARAIDVFLESYGILVQQSLGIRSPIPADVARQLSWNPACVSRTFGGIAPRSLWRYQKTV